MQITHILILTGATVVIGLLANNRVRDQLILMGSILAIFWLQPRLPIRNLDFYFPFAILALSLIVWLATRTGPIWEHIKLNRWTLLTIAGLVLLLGLLRYFPVVCCLTASLPPHIWRIALGLGIVVLLGITITISIQSNNAPVTLALILTLIAILIVLKSPPLAARASGVLRKLTQQSSDLASRSDIQWLGISYVIFRTLHVLVDFRLGRLKEVTLLEFFSYVIFFPTLTAGPIDRLDHFVEYHRKANYKLTWQTTYTGGRRILFGMFKKFVVSDTLALIAFNDSIVENVHNSWWLWLLLYAYLFRIFLDFSGYVDIAVGLGLLLGIEVPENFDRPLRKSNLTAFWNSWHITLATWFRAYYFHPVSRGLLRRWKRIPTPVIIAFCQITTMVLIGLWHGITTNFLIWGLVQGLGLFIHNRWATYMRTRLTGSQPLAAVSSAMTVLGTVLTFHFFAISLVWIAMTDPQTAFTVLTRLFFMG